MFMHMAHRHLRQRVFRIPLPYLFWVTCFLYIDKKRDATKCFLYRCMLRTIVSLD